MTSFSADPPGSPLPPAPDPGPPLGRKITRRSWQLVQETVEQAAGAARRAPGEIGGRGLDALRKLALIDPARMLGLIRRSRRVAPGSAFLAQAEAMLTARAAGWAEAQPLFLAPAARKTPGAAAAILRQRPQPAIWPALPAPERPAALSAAEAAGIVVYTASFGEAPGPGPLFHGVPGLRFLWLTDRAERAIPGWETVLAAPPPGVGPDRAAAWARILPAQALGLAAPAAEASLWLAPDRKLVGNAHTLMLRWLLPHDLVLWRSEAGTDWQDLAESHLIGAPDPASAEAVIAQAQACAEAGIRRNRGACDTGMIWRRHGAFRVAALMERWWQEDSAHPGLDAISLYAALNPEGSPGVGPGVIPHPEPAPGEDLLRILPAALGTADNNAFLAASPLNRSRRPHRAPPAGRPLPVGFLYAEKYAGAGSTVLRGKQLSELVARQYPDAIDMAYLSDAEAFRDRVVILTKGAIQTHSAEEIAELRRRNLAVIGSWDDMLPEADKMAAMDATMAVSNRQAHDFGQLFPRTPSYHVTHHVNSQIRPVTPPTDRIRTAYFGYPANTHRPDSLGHLIDFVGLDTANLEMSWIDLLPHYNCHWIIRRLKPHDGWKPFLKGFVAARCGAVLAVGREDEDAVQYLGDDYPFYVRGPDPKLLEYDMMTLAAAFGGPDWRRAQEIMGQVAARSSDAQVAAEFRAMVEDVLS